MKLLVTNPRTPMISRTAPTTRAYIRAIRVPPAEVQFGGGYCRPVGASCQKERDTIGESRRGAIHLPAEGQASLRQGTATIRSSEAVRGSATGLLAADQHAGTQQRLRPTRPAVAPLGCACGAGSVLRQRLAGFEIHKPRNEGAFPEQAHIGDGL